MVTAMPNSLILSSKVVSLCEGSGLCIIRTEKILKEIICSLNTQKFPFRNDLWNNLSVPIPWLSLSLAMRVLKRFWPVIVIKTNLYSIPSTYSTSCTVAACHIQLITVSVFKASLPQGFGYGIMTYMISMFAANPVSKWTKIITFIIYVEGTTRIRHPLTRFCIIKNVPEIQ